MSKISIVDLEVHFHVGVTSEERAKPQRLLLTVDMGYDFSTAAATDRVTRTIDYYKVTQKILKFGEGHSWKLIEKLAADVANLVVNDFYPTSVTVTVKKFPFPQASYVAVSLTKQRATTNLIKRSSWGIP